jgi:hypothetical protein
MSTTAKHNAKQLKITFIQRHKNVISLLLLISITLIIFSILNLPTEEIESKSLRWQIGVVYKFEIVSSLAVLLYFINNKKLSSLVFKNKTTVITTFLIIFSAIAGTALVLSFSEPDLPGQIYNISESNTIVKFQLSSYKGSENYIPGDKICVNLFITNMNDYSVNISGFTKLVVPDGSKNSSSGLRNLGTILTNRNEKLVRVLCVHILEEGLNTWTMNISIQENNTYTFLHEQELSPLVYTTEQMIERSNWQKGSLAAVVLFLTLIPTLIIDLKKIYEL